MSATSDRYDAIIIGSGQAGNPLAVALAEAGNRTAIIERRYVGGTCINEGCTPTKAMVASAKVANLARRAEDFGVRTGSVEVDLPKVVARKNDIVESFRSSNRNRLQEAENIDLLWGSARFLDPHALSVSQDGQEQRIDGDTIVINTGARPRIPDIAGLDNLIYLTSRSILELEEIPDHLIVIGGGHVGLEFGQMFRRFGSQVTVLTTGGQLLTREDPDIAFQVQEILEQDGLTIQLDSRPAAARNTTSGLEIEFNQKEVLQTVQGSHLLLAAGRVPNTPDLDLAAAGIEPDQRGFIEVDGRLRTSVAHIYAVGDVKGGPAFTHISYDDFRIMRENLLGQRSRTTSDRPVPYTLYIDPQLGRIGLNEMQARQEGIEYQVARMPMSHVARAIETGQTRGVMKALVDPPTGQILGAAILGTEGGELMGALQIAMMGNVTYQQLREAIFAHPTLIESFNNLFANLGNP